MGPACILGIGGGARGFGSAVLVHAHNLTTRLFLFQDNMGIQHEMCVGLKKGKKVTPIAKKTRPSSMKGVG